MSGDEQIDIDSIRLLTDKYSLEILFALDEFKTASELSEEIDVPQATCYRRISDLSETSLITTQTENEYAIGTSGGGSRTVYKRDVDSIHIDFLNESVVNTK